MDFGLSEEQRLLEDSLRRYLEESCSVARVREITAAGSGTDRELWGGLAELGAAGVIVPEEYGGSGLHLLDAALIAESLGRFVAPTPFLGTSVMATLALLRAGSDPQKKEWLPRFATGDAVAGVAVTESYSRREDAGVRASGGSLSGKALFALDAGACDVLLVSSEEGDLWLVAPDAAGLSVEPLKTIDRTRQIDEVLFDQVEPLARLGGEAETALAFVCDAARIVLAADTLGAAECMLEQAVVYAGQREQFGRVIGSFQAVKHLCAEMAASLEPARSLLWYAAHSYDEVPDDAALMATHAKAHLSEVGSSIAKTATEVHGGIGFTDEQNLHFWFKRLGLNRQLLGGPELLRERAATLQGWT